MKDILNKVPEKTTEEKFDFWRDHSLKFLDMASRFDSDKMRKKVSFEV